MEFVQGALVMGVAALIGSLIAGSISLFVISALTVVVAGVTLWLNHKHKWTDRSW